MLRRISNQLQGSCIGPIQKPLNATNHDCLGNPLSTVQQIHDGTHGVQAFVAQTTVVGFLNGGLSSFTLGGTTYSPTTIQVAFIPGQHGGYAYAIIIASGSTILTDLQSNGLDQTLGIRFTGSRGTETYYASSSNRWRNDQNTNTNRIELSLINENTTSGWDTNTFLAWEANNTYWGTQASHNQTDTTSIAYLIS